jgi:acetolactate synthase-1/2/3 large subunit
MNGGELVARTLAAQGVEHLFTLCGGHISPILVEAKRLGIRVLDTRHEADAVFAADAVARLTGRPAVAVVTAGPGVTNTVTALQNARLAQSPVVVLAGAAATLLKGRGALQDIDQLALAAPLAKWAVAVERVRELPEAVATALRVAAAGVPGPAFVECPVDLLYSEELVREQYGSGAGKGLSGRLLAWYLSRHVDRLFRGAAGAAIPEPVAPDEEPAPARQVGRAAERLRRARRPVLVVGNQAMIHAGRPDHPAAAGRLAEAVGALGVPTYLASTARGLLGADHPLQMRHRRRQALRDSDLVILAGYPADFRLDYGRQVPRRTALIAANLSDEELNLNRRPDLGVQADPARFLLALSARVAETGRGEGWGEWIETLRQRDAEREAEIDRMAAAETEHLNPLALCRAIDRVLPDDAVLVADGGDFVATAAYTVRPRGPLGWLDPGAFGTLGVGGGFALGAGVVRPGSEIWVLYGDGSVAYSLAEFDAFARHGVPVIAVVGNDAGWTQIAREQVPMLGDPVGTVLARTDYHLAAEGYGGKGLLLDRPEKTDEVLAEARRLAGQGHPVLINAWIGATEFRKGSMSM